MFNVGFWIMDGERCLIMDFGFWIMDGERCLIMDFGFWIMDFQLFFLSSTIYNSTSIISLDMAPPFQSQRRTVKGDV